MNCAILESPEDTPLAIAKPNSLPVLIPYLLLGAVLWGCMLFSGIHATLAGVVLRLLHRALRAGPRLLCTSLRMRSHCGSHFWFSRRLVSPMLVWLSASLELVVAPLPLGIAGGLFLGKQAGIMAAVWLCCRAGIAHLPARATWRQTYGVALLCGIGFTMSLFIGLLAFSDPDREAGIKLAVLAGSLLSAIVGGAVLISNGRAARRV